MVATTNKPSRAPRADAVANRERLAAVASTMFRSSDQPVTMEAVAKQAGVGIGTLYRHFATREALAAVVYRLEVDELVVLAGALDDAADAVDALRRWLRATVDFVATKKGIAEALSWSARMPPEYTAYASNHLPVAVDSLLRRAMVARHANASRVIDAQNLLRVLIALCYEFNQPGWQAQVNALLDLFVDGLLGSRD